MTICGEVDCEGCADKFNKITEDDIMKFIKSRVLEADGTE